MTPFTMLRCAAAWALTVTAGLLAGCGGGGGGSSAPPPAGAAIVSISPTDLPPPSMGVSYTTTLSASGGTAPYGFGISGGALPDGLFLNGNTGTIAGTPSRAGLFSVTINAVASSGDFGERIYSVLVVDAVSITTSALADGEEQVAYSQRVDATGGVGPYTWSVASGALPPGLALSASTGLSVQVQGSPSGPVVSAGFDLRVQDAQGRSAVKHFTITIANTYRVFFTADLDVNGQNELYLVVLDENLNPRAPVKVSGTLNPSDGDVTPSFALSPDGKKVAYIADAGFDAVPELFIVDLSTGTPGTARKVNSTFTASTGGKVLSFQWSPDSTKIAWHAEAFVASEYNMFFADVTGATITQRQANPVTTVALQATVGGVGISGAPNLNEDYGWSFDSTYLAFEADTVSRGNTSRTNPRVPDAFVCDTTTPLGQTPTARRVNTATLPGGTNNNGFVSWLQWAPGKDVLVFADSTAVLVTGTPMIEVYSVAISGSVSATPPSIVAQRPAILKTSDASPGFGGGCDFSPDGSKLALRYVPNGNNNFVDPYALFVAPVTASGLATAQAVTITTSGNGDAVNGYAWSPDSRTLLLGGRVNTSAAQTQMATCDVSGATPGPLVPVPVTPLRILSTPYASFAFTPDSTRFTYVTKATNPQYGDLEMLPVSVQPATASAQVSGVINAFGSNVGVQEFDPVIFYSPDSQQVAYLSEQNVDNQVELFVTEIGGNFPGPAIQVSPTPASVTGDVQGVPPNATPVSNLRPIPSLVVPQWSPDARLLLFRGDLNRDEQFDLYLWDSTQVGAPVVHSVVPVLATRPGALGVTGYKLLD